MSHRRMPSTTSSEAKLGEASAAPWEGHEMPTTSDRPTSADLARVHPTLALNMRVMTQADKRGFNAIITGLSILLGLAIVGGLNAMVGDMRWWVLSRTYKSRTKVEKILRADSIMQLVRLATKSKRPSIIFGVAFWLVVILGCQIAVASLNLLYATALSRDMATYVDGSVGVVDLSHIFTDQVVVASTARTLGAEQYTANSYGIISTVYQTGLGFDTMPEPGALFYPGSYFLWYNPTNNTFAYLFRETNLDSLFTNGIWAVTAATDRTVEVGTSCKSWNVVAGADGQSEDLLIQAADEAKPTKITVPLAPGRDQTLYMTNPDDSCGDYCSPVTAFETTNDGAWYYKCNVTLQPVRNAVRKEHTISPEVGKLATSAIALQGYGVSSLSKDNSTQFQTYPLESVYGSTAHGNPVLIGEYMSRFAIGVIAVIAESNNQTVINNTQTPEVGVTLEVESFPLVTLVLVGITGLQLVLEIIVAYLSNKVVVPSTRGGVSVAQVLRAMTEDTTKAWSEKGLSSITQSGEMPENTAGKWKYVVTPLGNGLYDLAMEKAL